MKIVSLAQEKLKSLESIIDTGINAAWSALKEIHDEQLYKADYSSFEDYCKERWNWSKQRAYQLISAAEVAKNVSTIVDTLPNEGQLREVAKAGDADLQRAAYGVAQTIAEQNKAGKVTAKDVKKAVDLVHEVIKENPNIGQEEIAAKAVEKGAIADIETPPSETEILRDQLSEMAAQQEEMLSELKTLGSIADADDKLAEALKQVKQYKEAARIAKERLDGIMNEKNELIRMVKSLQAKLKKAGIK